ncbi:orotidine-5'-phosphate decarboxylase [Candidatus Dependentiae bacterium]|nr:MAG: orotidine-5'-phosphate decarboxylase [Candidatus Dependentiae bacterium]
MIAILCLFLLAPFLSNSMETVFNPTKENLPFYLKLEQQVKEKNSILCVGLDPDWEKIPNDIKNLITMNQNTLNFTTQKTNIIKSFLITVIDRTAKQTCAFKIQYACFLSYPGLLEKIVNYIKKDHKDIPVILDCKIGDIENTMQFYVDYFFNTIKADAVTVNPYMGQDVAKAFMDDPQKGCIGLIQSSNPSGAEVQNSIVSYTNPITNQTSNITLWQKMLLLLTHWNQKNNIGAVISGNLSPDYYKWIRNTVGQDFFVLVPGVGAQGADPEKFLTYLINEKRSGVIVNVSRGILYNYDINDPAWYLKIEAAALQYKEAFNNARFNENF